VAYIIGKVFRAHLNVPATITVIAQLLHFETKVCHVIIDEVFVTKLET